jgi:hypothetical protein
VAEERFHGVLGSREARWLWPDSRLLGSLWTRGVPVDLAVGDEGVTVSTRTRLLRGGRWSPVTLSWAELAGAACTSAGHVGRTGGLTLRESFQVVLHVVGPRAAGYRTPADPGVILPGFPADLDVTSLGGFALLGLTMPRGDEFASAVEARATGQLT